MRRRDSIFIMSLLELYTNCALCPRQCGIDRLRGKKGYCRGGTDAEVALTMLHRWEEPCISGTDPARGSGAIFFARCTLGCVYCQNYAISRPDGPGQGTFETVDADRLAAMMLDLQERGAYNINLVTPTHFMPVIAEAVLLARKRGLALPVVYNTSGFERREIIRQLEGIVDVFLTDMKYDSNAIALRYSATSAYRATAWAALRTMFRITGAGLDFDDDGMLRRGVIVRHLVLPGRAFDAVNIIKKLYSRFGDNVVYSLMNQYTPLPEGNPRLSNFPELLSPVSADEYARAVAALESFAPAHAYIQEGGTISDSFIPQFSNSPEKKA